MYAASRHGVIALRPCRLVRSRAARRGDQPRYRWGVNEITFTGTHEGTGREGRVDP